MLRVGALLAVAGAIAIGPASAVHAQSAECANPLLGCVDVTNNGTSVTIGATETTPGSSTTDTAQTEGEPEPAPEDTLDVESCMEASVCPGRYTVTESVDGVTLADVASFAPADATVAMEPNGWIVTGLPANFYSTAGVHIESGALLGETADVRFTPVSFAWSYGDGSARTVETPGASWAALGQDEFTETATSHVYSQAGTFTVGLVVGYRAEYRFLGADWTRIAGTLDVPDDPFEIEAGTASTVLVGADCSAAPDEETC